LRTAADRKNLTAYFEAAAGRALTVAMLCDRRMPILFFYGVKTKLQREALSLTEATVLN
jgi:hypothetical protein